MYHGKFSKIYYFDAISLSADERNVHKISFISFVFLILHAWAISLEVSQSVNSIIRIDACAVIY